MDIKQMAKGFVLKESGIISAICFILSCLGYGFLKFLQPSIMRFELILCLYVLLVVTIFCTRVTYLSKLLNLPDADNCTSGFKLLLFDFSLFVVTAALVMTEFVIFALFRSEWYIFYIFSGLTGIFFVLMFFSYISVAEIGYLKKEIRLVEFFKPEIFNKKYSTELLAKFTAITLVQFCVALIFVFVLIKTCLTPWLWVISTFGSYIMSLFILKLEELKLYYKNRADIAQMVE